MSKDVRKNPQAVAIFGASSAVAIQAARLHAVRGDSLVLYARDEEKLDVMKADLLARGAVQVETKSSDLSDRSHHENLLQFAEAELGTVDRYYVFYGVLPNQAQCEQSVEATIEALNTNFISTVALLTLIAKKVADVAPKTIVVVSSVAGDRGRQSNYIYGTGKGGLSIFMQGLRNRLSKSGHTVLNVKPGFIDTPMTADIEKGGPLWASPELVARDIVTAADKGKDEIYSPWFWRYIMLVILLIPEFIFKKLSL